MEGRAASARFLVLLLTVSLASTRVVHHIRPTLETLCPYEDCLTLSEYTSVATRSSDISNNLTLRFLPGEHSLNETIVFRLLQNLLLLGTANISSTANTTSKIICNNSTPAFIFTNISKVEIKGLALSQCEDKYSSGSIINMPKEMANFAAFPAIGAFYIPNLRMINCKLEHNNVLALLLYRTKLIARNCVFSSNEGLYGGAVRIQDGNGSFEGQTVFNNNTAAMEGGGIYANHSKLTFAGSVTFTRNSAVLEGGGARLLNSNMRVKRDQPSGEYVANSDSYYGYLLFQQNTAENGGGISLEESTFIAGDKEIVNYTRNWARSGGGISTLSTYVTLRGLTAFIGNHDRTSMETSAGGGMYASSSSFYSGALYAEKNWADYGAVVFLEDSRLSIYTGRKDNKLATVFTSNWATYGGAIYLLDSFLQVGGSSTFEINFALIYGGAIYLDGSELHLEAEPDKTGIKHEVESEHLGERSITFVGNHGGTGGGIHATNSVLTISGKYTFKRNHALTTGGGIFVENCSLNLQGKGKFVDSRAEYGGAISAKHDARIMIEGTSYYVANIAAMYGGAMSIEDSNLQLLNTSAFLENSAPFGGALLVHQRSNLSMLGINHFESNSALPNGYGGAIYVLGSKVSLKGTQSFINNSAAYGGGIFFSDYDQTNILYVPPNTLTQFVNNYAMKHGGAMAVNDNPVTSCAYLTQDLSSSEQVVACFFQTEEGDCLPSSMSDFYIKSKNVHQYVRKLNVSLSFKGNYAEEGGHMLYGGVVEYCEVCYNHYSQDVSMSGLDTLTIVTNEQISDGQTSIASVPFQVRSCDNGTLYMMVIYPGQTVQVEMVAVGQVHGIVSAVIHATLEHPELSWLGPLQATQTSNLSCTALEYTLHAVSTSVRTKLRMFPEGPCGRWKDSLVIHIEFLPCPDGFSLTEFGVCECQKRLQRYTNSCNIDDQTLTRNGAYWVGFDYHGLILHPHCPFDYCTMDTVSFELNSTDLQCARAYGRSGTLCGACKPGLSLNLGGSRCSPCSNMWLLLLFPIVIAGLLLVVSLFICKVTVAAGTTSGLIFYANVVWINRSLFFLSGESNILTIFLAWLNLDLGIETCFYNGMDMYVRTWLQFAFPVYIWLLVGGVALLTSRSMTVARIIGPTNPIAVLATLFLLSYIKLLRTIIATFSFTTLEYPNDRKVNVWVYDGNIGYLEGKHIPLLLAGLLAFLLLFVPYTLLLLFGQWIQARSNHKLLSWANNPKFRSFLDAYHAPYENQHRYWTGLLPLLRFILFTISAVIDINSPKDPSINFLLLGIVCVGLAIWMCNTGSIYKSRFANVLESSFFLNLGVLTLASYQVKVEGGSQAAVVYTSVSTAFVTFLGIITYHVTERMCDSRLWRLTICPKLQSMKQQLSQRLGRERQDSNEMSAPPAAPQPQVPCSVIELREPLLESYT